jgi:alpha-ketoglutarate-dependent taurine dioxygenase
MIAACRPSSPPSCSPPLTIAPPHIEPEGQADLQALLDLAAARRAELDAQLLEHGALVLRGWTVRTLEDFAQVVAAVSGEASLFNYAGGASPRNALNGAGLYTSTEYPPHVALSLHNELSYADVHPRRLFFFCLVAAETGGETTLADSRRILQALDPEVADAFRRRGVATSATSRRAGRRLFLARGLRVRGQGRRRGRLPPHRRRLRMAGRRRPAPQPGAPAVARHPVTGEEVWFNQADGFHPSALDPETHAAMLAHHGSEDRFRLNAAYGDGGPIEPAALDHVRAVLRDQTVPHAWREGDVVCWTTTWPPTAATPSPARAASRSP